MNRFLPLSFCLLLLCAGCSHPPQKKPRPPAHRVVGTIVAVNEDQRFVLIDAGTNFPAEKGAALKTFLDGRETGVLTVSDQRRPPFVIADIVGGSPQKGDQVME